ncbi:MAG: hypothetical protein ACRD3T_12710 [Terriglobia bacterium]
MEGRSFSRFGKLGARMQWIRWAGLCLIVWFLGLSLPAYAQRQGTFVTFDVPGASTAIDQGTFPMSINPVGEITGFYIDTNSVAHGFVRAADGTITTVDPPGSVYTLAHAINPAGAITGDWYDANSVDHGFVRASDGTFTTFDVPGAYFFATAGSINPAGDVTGTYFDTNFAGHGFLRTVDGTITTIDAPDAETGSFNGTQAFAIDPQGTVAGCYADAQFVGHGFVFTRDGTLTTFDLPNSGVAGYWGGCYFDGGYFFIGGIPLVGINPSGAIAGTYFQPISGNPFGGNYRGYLRAKGGSFTTFDAVPSPSSPCCTWTNGIAINPAGVIAGYYNDFHSVNHGFVRAKDGTVTTLDAPGANTTFGQGTWAFSINPAGQVTGQYDDANYVFHGFLWIPPAQWRNRQ